LSFDFFSSLSFIRFFAHHFVFFSRSNRRARTQVSLQRVESAAEAAAQAHGAQIDLIAAQHAAEEARLAAAARRAKASERGAAAQLAAARGEASALSAERSRAVQHERAASDGAAARREKLEQKVTALEQLLESARRTSADAARATSATVRGAVERAERVCAAEAEARLRAAVELATVNATRSSAARRGAVDRAADEAQRKLRSTEGEVALLCDEVQKLRLTNAAHTEASRHSRRLLDESAVQRLAAASHEATAEKVSVLLCTVTFYANLAHSLTRSPLTYLLTCTSSSTEARGGAAPRAERAARAFGARGAERGAARSTRARTRSAPRGVRRRGGGGRRHGGDARRPQVCAMLISFVFPNPVFFCLLISFVPPVFFFVCSLFVRLLDGPSDARARIDAANAGAERTEVRGSFLLFA
jgi:hypothetical protein